MRSCSSLFCIYCVAILPTKGSAGLQSVRSEHIESNTLDIVRAGDQLSFRMSKHITPWLLMLQWYILVRNVTFGGLNGYSGEKWMSRKNTPPSYTEPGGPRMVDTHSYKLSPFGPALQFGGGSNVISANSFWILLADVPRAFDILWFGLFSFVSGLPSVALLPRPVPLPDEPDAPDIILRITVGHLVGWRYPIIYDFWYPITSFWEFQVFWRVTNK